MVILCLALWEVDKLSSKIVTPFCFLLALNESFLCYMSSQAFGIVSFKNFSHFSRYTVLSHCFSCYISLMVYDIEHRLMCLSFICISLVRYFMIILNWVLIDVLRVICIFWIYQIHILQILSPSLSFAF